VAVNHVFVAGADLDGNYVSGEFCGEGQFARGAHGAILGHEKCSSAHNTLERAENSTATSKLGVRGHLNRAAHPGKLTGLRDDGVIGIEDKLKDRHSGADNLIAHG